MSLDEHLADWVALQPPIIQGAPSPEQQAQLGELAAKKKAWLKQLSEKVGKSEKAIVKDLGKLAKKRKETKNVCSGKHVGSAQVESDPKQVGHWRDLPSPVSEVHCGLHPQNQCRTLWAVCLRCPVL